MTINDLILTEDADGQREMSAVVDGELVGPFPNKGSIIKLARAICRLEQGERFDHNRLDDWIGELAFMHFENLRRRANRAGQGYPFRIPAPASAKEESQA